MDSNSEAKYPLQNAEIGWSLLAYEKRIDSLVDRIKTETGADPPFSRHWVCDITDQDLILMADHFCLSNRYTMWTHVFYDLNKYWIEAGHGDEHAMIAKIEQDLTHCASLGARRGPVFLLGAYAHLLEVSLDGGQFLKDAMTEGRRDEGQAIQSAKRARKKWMDRIETLKSAVEHEEESDYELLPRAYDHWSAKVLPLLSELEAIADDDVRCREEFRSSWYDRSVPKSGKGSDVSQDVVRCHAALSHILGETNVGKQGQPSTATRMLKTWEVYLSPDTAKKRRPP